jgi:hypothetical protein
MSNLKPKCLNGKPHSFHHSGHVLPCCWLNDQMHDPKCKTLFSEEMHIDNFNTVEEIFETKIWKNFFRMLKKSPSNAPRRCWKMCILPLDVDPEVRAETKINFKK